MKRCCGTCVSYLTDEDERGNVAEFRHDRNKPEGFCALRDLFHAVSQGEKPCGDYHFDKEGGE